MTTTVGMASSDSKKIFGPSNRALPQVGNIKKPSQQQVQQQQQQEMFLLDENQIKLCTSFDSNSNGTLNNCLNLSPTGQQYEFETTTSSSTSANQQHQYHHSKSPASRQQQLNYYNQVNTSGNSNHNHQHHHHQHHHQSRHNSSNNQTTSNSSNSQQNHHQQQQQPTARNIHDKTLSIVGSILDVPLPSENDAFSEYSTFVNNIFSK